MSRILITGGTGFIGGHLVDHLLAHNHELILLVRETYVGSQPLPRALACIRDRFELVFADLRSLNLVNRAVKEAAADSVIHLAAAGASDPFLNPETAVRHNVTGTINLLRAAFEKGDVQRLIIARTPGELASMNPYAASKKAAWSFAEMYAATRGWPIFGGMIFQCYGPGQPPNMVIPAAVRAALSGHDFPMTAGTQVRDWIAVDDVTAGLRAMVAAPDLTPGDTVELGTGVGSSVAEVVELIYELSGAAGRPLVGKLPSRPGEMPTQIANIAQTKAQIGWRPQITLKEGLGRLIQLKKQEGV